MPIYEYDCPKCGTFEVMQNMNDPALTSHQECGEPVKRKVSRSSFALKGHGWHADGYSSNPSSASGTCVSGGGCGTGACGQ